MNSIRETESAARNSPDAILAEPAAVSSILTRSDTMLVAVGLGVFGILVVLVTCL